MRWVALGVREAGKLHLHVAFDDAVAGARNVAFEGFAAD